MGVLAARFRDEIRDRADWLSDDDDTGYFDGKMTAAGVRVNETVAFSLPTFWRCVDLLTSSVSQSPKDVFLKIGGQSFPEYGKPEWLTRPTPLDPTFTTNDHFAQVVLSLLLNGSFFTHVYPHVLDPQVLTVLNPNRVSVKKGPLYEVRDEHGQVVNTLGPMEILHGSWIRPAGSLRGINPISMLSRSLGSAIAAEDFAGRFFGQGAALSFGVEVPYALTSDKQSELREQMKRRYAGALSSHAIGVLSDGAKFVPGLAPTPEQAQMLDTRKFAVIETCRPFGVPAIMAGSTDPGATSYASSEMLIKTMYQQNAVQPLAARIEPHYERLLSVPDTVTDPTASAAFRFNLDWIVRANLLERYQAHSEGVRGGFLAPNEARKFEDRPPIKGGDQLFMQQQMVPIDQLGLALPAAPAARSTEAAT